MSDGRIGSWANEDHVMMLRALWIEGLSASQIAKIINAAHSDAAYTRNAIIGKAHRIGLTVKGTAYGRAAASAPARLKAAPNVARAPKAAHLSPRPAVIKLAGNSMVFHEPAVSRPPRVVVPFRQEAPGLATPMTLQPHQCKWPIGTPGAEDFTHCGQRAPDGPYCASHAEIAYRPPEERKTSANELARSLRRYL